MPDTAVKRPRKPGANASHATAFLAGGGDTAKRMRLRDWARTLLGTPTAGPRACGPRCASSSAPATDAPFLGDRYATLYNDAAKALVCGKHPGLIGEAVEIAWPDLWTAIGAHLQHVRGASEAAYLDSVDLPVAGRHAGEPARFAMSLTPLPGDDGGPGGVLCVLNETESFHEDIIEISSQLDRESVIRKVTAAATRITKARYGVFAPAGDPQAIRLDDASNDARQPAIAAQFQVPSGQAVRSFLAVPVQARGGDRLGTLLLGHDEPSMFDTRAERNARALAAHAAVAIDNANLFTTARWEIEERSRAEETLTQLHELAARLTAVEDMDSALQAILETAVSLQGAQLGSINLHDRAKGGLVLRATVGFDEAARAEMAVVKLGPSSTACASCYQHQARVTVLDTETDPGLREFPRVLAPPRVSRGPLHSHLHARRRAARRPLRALRRKPHADDPRGPARRGLRTTRGGRDRASPQPRGGARKRAPLSRDRRIDQLRRLGVRRARPLCLRERFLSQAHRTHAGKLREGDVDPHPAPGRRDARARAVEGMHGLGARLGSASPGAYHQRRLARDPLARRGDPRGGWPHHGLGGHESRHRSPEARRGRAARARPAQERVPGHARPRASQPPSPRSATGSRSCASGARIRAWSSRRAP
jgi:GAF domain-containing protein